MKRFAAILMCTVPMATTAWSQGAAPAPPATASSMLSPALDQLRTTLSDVRIDKWKAPGAVREDASSNLGSIRNDLDATLPGLLAASDAAPGDLVHGFPVYRNLDALYDVLLRVVQTAALAAPDTEASELQSTLGALEDARRNFGESLENAAIAQQAQVVALNTQIKQLKALPPPAPTKVVDEDAKTSAEHRRHHRVVKPAPAQPAAQAPQ